MLFCHWLLFAGERNAEWPTWDQHRFGHHPSLSTAVSVCPHTVAGTAHPTCTPLSAPWPAEPRACFQGTAPLAKPDFGSQMPRGKAMSWLSQHQECSGSGGGIHGEGLGACRGCLWAPSREESPGLCLLVQAVTMNNSVTSSACAGLSLLTLLVHAPLQAPFPPRLGRPCGWHVTEILMRVAPLPEPLGWQSRRASGHSQHLCL